MKIYTLVFVALTTVFLYTEYVNTIVVCPEENCITPKKCENPGTIVCRQQGTICCSVVKEEFRTHCRHHGGECMDECSWILQRKAVDCPSNQVCCVLVY